MCRLLRAAGADKVVDAIDLPAARHVMAEHETTAWIIVADPDAFGADGVRALADLDTKEYAIAFLLLCNRRAEALEALRSEAREQQMNLLAALRKPVSVEEIGSLFRRLPAEAHGGASDRRHRLTKDELAECLRLGRFKARFQPRIDLATGRPVACEAVPFVMHLHRGEVPPEGYAKAMAELGAQRVMAASVLRDAAELVRALREKNLKVGVAVGLAPEVLSESGDAATLDAYVRTLGVAPADLILEIGESARPSPHLAENLARLKLRGYALAMDASKGSARIDHPAHTHFSEIKLARTLLARAGTDAEVARTVASTLRTAHRFGMVACAAGIDAAEDLEQARALGIDLGQGALFADCVPAAEVVAWVEREEGMRSFRQIAPKRQRIG